jgi:membrane protein DedA with SNARE-associated domain
MLTMVAAWLDSLSILIAASTEPWVILPTLVLITFLLEDVAIAAGVALVLNGTIGLPAAFISVAGGIALGDIGLYGLGRLAVRLPSLRRRLGGKRLEHARLALERRLTTAVLVARVVPGLRLATYMVAGLIGVSFPRFAALAAAAAAVWTAGLFWLTMALGRALGDVLEHSLGLNPTSAVIVAILLLAVFITFLSRLLRGDSPNDSVNTRVSR